MPVEIISHIRIYENRARRRYNKVIFPNVKTNDTHSSPVGASYGVSFHGLKVGVVTSVLVAAVIYAISCCIGPHYNGIRLCLPSNSIFVIAGLGIEMSTLDKTATTAYVQTASL